MFTISKRFEFSASHVLEGLADDHPCSRLHGHNYAVEVELQAITVDAVGFVFDYRRLDTFKAWLDDLFDHRHLNDVLLANPTAENLALFVSQHVRLVVSLPDHVECSAVRVYETPKTCAEYRP